MSDRPAVGPEMVYLFDGSFWGLLCCVYECYTRREQVVGVLREDAGCFSLYPTRLVETDEQHAERVYRSLETKLGKQGEELVTTAYLCGDDDKDDVVFRFIQLGYRYGRRACDMLGDETVLRIHKICRTVWNEQHHYKGFVRFSECSLPLYQEPPTQVQMPTEGLALAGLQGLASQGSKNALAAVIEPRHNVLPLISAHFCSRYPEENFMIYDKVRGQALVYRPYKAELMPLEGFSLPALSDEEQLCQRLWKGYYDAIAIQSRLNPRCRMNFMPKRFWNYLPEMQG